MSDSGGVVSAYGNDQRVFPFGVGGFRVSRIPGRERAL